MIDKTSDLMLWFIWDFLENIFQFLMLILLFFSVVDHSSPRSTSTIRLRYSYITAEVEGNYSCRFFCPTTPSTKLSWTPGPFTSSISTLCQSWRLVGSPPSLLSRPFSRGQTLDWTGRLKAVVREDNFVPGARFRLRSWRQRMKEFEWESLKHPNKFSKMKDKYLQSSSTELTIW